jgi:GNAT superfamily N-acetyltransferase
VLYRRELLDRGVVCGWLAEFAGQPAGTAWFSKAGGLLGVLEMMTAPDHRRRGVGGQMLRTGMSHELDDHIEGAFLWSSPIGRGVYEAAGFEPVDEMTVWGRGADDLLELIGQHKRADT